MLSDRVQRWRDAGELTEFRGRHLYVQRREGRLPLLPLLHGFPSSSYDGRTCLDGIGGNAALVFDCLGFGLSDKPADHTYTLAWQETPPRSSCGVAERETLTEHWHGAVRDWSRPLSLAWGLDDPVATTRMLDGLDSSGRGCRASSCRLGHYPHWRIPTPSRQRWRRGDAARSPIGVRADRCMPPHLHRVARPRVRRFDELVHRAGGKGEAGCRARWRATSRLEEELRTHVFRLLGGGDWGRGPDQERPHAGSTG